MRYLILALVVLVGCGIPFQVAANKRLEKAVHSLALSVTLAFAIGAAAMAALVANVCTLVWYAVVYFDSLKLSSEKRLVWPIVSWLGLAGCAALFVSLPRSALAAGAAALALAVATRWVVRRTWSGKVVYVSSVNK